MSPRKKESKYNLVFHSCLVTYSTTPLFMIACKICGNNPISTSCACTVHVCDCQVVVISVLVY